jgi:hypothetical protein
MSFLVKRWKLGGNGIRIVGNYSKEQNEKMEGEKMGSWEGIR